MDDLAIRASRGMRIYWHLAVARTRSDFQYPTSATLLTVLSVVLTGTDLAVLALILRAVPTLGGFDLRSAAFIYALSLCGFQLCNGTFGTLDYLGIRIKEGSFDQLLVRPVGTVLQVMAEQFSLRGLGRMLYGVVVLVVAANVAPIGWTPASIAYLVVVVAAGAITFSGVFIATAALSFWLVDAREVANSVTYGGGYVSEYPASVYEGWFKGLFFYVLPYAFVAWVPAIHLLHRPDPLGFPAWFRLLPVPVAIATFAGGALAWRAGLRHHTSTGT